MDSPRGDGRRGIRWPRRLDHEELQVACPRAGAGPPPGAEGAETCAMRDFRAEQLQVPRRGGSEIPLRTASHVTVRAAWK